MTLAISSDLKHTQNMHTIGQTQRECSKPHKIEII